MIFQQVAVTNKHFYLLLLAWLLPQAPALAEGQGVRVACIGNSVTYGTGLKDPATQSYPSRLQKMLGDKFLVGNFGSPGATLLKKGHKPYYKTIEFSAALSSRPDIAILHLGLNDTDPRNWPNFRDEFERDYNWLIDTLRKQNPTVKIYICKLTPIFSGHPRFKSGTRDWYRQIQDLIPQIAAANQVGLIDLNSALNNRPDLFADHLHPDETGAGIIAQTVYQYLTGKYGGLKLPVNFSDHMVLQRNKPIPVYGTANAMDTIAVTINRKTIKVVTGDDGKWRVQFPAMTAGGPYELTVFSRNKQITIKDVLIGDVWLCSGQSNMAFPLKQAATGHTELRSKATLPLLRLFRHKLLSETGNTAWDSLTLEKTNALQFFDGNWATTDSASSADFSAIAYYFGKKILASENVPIGLIQVAVGGSTTESWIDRFSMEQDNLLVNEFSNWRNNDFIQPWARERANLNLQNSSNPRQRHPYEPSYNYEAGIAPLTSSPITGIIWYQGESNTHNAELHNHLFTTLVNSWRRGWGYDFPFYFVQLPGIDRSSWPYFRDAQRRLQKQIANTSMAVSYDLGDSLDVHPTKKKEVGERLALLALRNNYRRPVTANGPEVMNAVQTGNELVVSFSFTRQLATNNQRPVNGLELVTTRGDIRTYVPSIQKNKLIINLLPGEKIKLARYAWQPFTRANLLNEAGLPAPTFSIEVTNQHKP